MIIQSLTRVMDLFRVGGRILYKGAWLNRDSVTSTLLWRRNGSSSLKVCEVQRSIFMRYWSQTVLFSQKDELPGGNVVIRLSIVALAVDRGEILRITLISSISVT